MEQGKPITKLIMAIGLNEDNVLTVSGQMANKMVCMMALTDAMKLVIMHDPSPIVVPKVSAA